MVDMNDFDVEVKDERGSDPEHVNGTVTTAGFPDSLTLTSGKPIQLALVKNPSRGPNRNDFPDVLLVNIDGGATELSLSRGEALYLPGVYTALSIDSNNNGVKYEVILWG